MSSRSTTLHTAQLKSPPGPRRLNPLSSTLAFQRDPLAFLSNLAQQYGDIAQFRLLLWPTFVINHPDHIKHVLQENYRNYDKDVLLFKVVRPLMGNGLIINPGQTWLQQRRLIQPAFHKKRIAAFGTLMTDATIAMLQRWESNARSNQTLDLPEPAALPGHCPPS